jgi:HEAT repeat protein
MSRAHRLVRVLGRPAVLALALAAASAGCTTTSDHGVPYGRNELREEEMARRVEEIRFLSGRELVDNLYALATLGEEVTPHLRSGMRSDNALTRSSLAWVAGVRGDRRNIPAVRGLLADPVREVRYEAAAALVRLGDNAGFPALVEGLADGELRNRYKCFQALNAITGQDFGYRHDGDADTRRLAVTRWLDWLAAVRATSL